MSKSDPLRVAFIGAGGRWGPRAPGPVVQKMKEVYMQDVV